MAAKSAEPRKIWPRRFAHRRACEASSVTKSAKARAPAAESAPNRARRPSRSSQSGVLPECRTHDTPLPGGWGLDESREALTALDILSESGVNRLISIYGGRAIGIVELLQRHSELAHCIDTDHRILAAEVIFAIREEMAQTLVDIVYRRMMVGLDADQGRALYDEIATLAAAELQWGESQLVTRLNELRAFSESLRVPR